MSWTVYKDLILDTVKSKDVIGTDSNGMIIDGTTAADLRYLKIDQSGTAQTVIGGIPDFSVGGKFGTSHIVRLGDFTDPVFSVGDWALSVANNWGMNVAVSFGNVYGGNYNLAQFGQGSSAAYFQGQPNGGTATNLTLCDGTYALNVSGTTYLQATGAYALQAFSVSGGTAAIKADWSSAATTYALEVNGASIFNFIGASNWIIFEPVAAGANGAQADFYFPYASRRVKINDGANGYWYSLYVEGSCRFADTYDIVKIIADGTNNYPLYVEQQSGSGTTACAYFKDYNSRYVTIGGSTWAIETDGALHIGVTGYSLHDIMTNSGNSAMLFSTIAGPSTYINYNDGSYWHGLDITAVGGDAVYTTASGGPVAVLIDHVKSVGVYASRGGWSYASYFEDPIYNNAYVRMMSGTDAIQIDVGSYGGYAINAIGKSLFTGSTATVNIITSGGSTAMSGTDGTRQFYLSDGSSAGYFFGVSTDEVRLINSGYAINAVGTVYINGLLDSRQSAVFNEDGGDYDFRVEGDADANLLFCDAGNGRVGIGTSSPSQKLDVQGNIATGTNIIGGGKLYGYSAGGNSTTLQLYNIGTGYTTLNNIGYGISLQTASTDRITILNGGTVGINNTNPTALLDLVEPATTTVGLSIKRIANQSVPAFQFLDAGGTFNRFEIDGDGRVITVVNSNTDTGSDALVADFRMGTGYVSDAVVQVRNSNATQKAYFKANGYGCTYTHGCDSAGGFNYIETADKDLYYRVAGTGKIYFQTAGGTERLRITDTGKVGINTTNPSHILQTETAIGSTFGAISTDSNLRGVDTTAQTTGVGGGVCFYGKYNNAAAITFGAGIKTMKSNSTSDNYDFDLAFGTRKTGAGTLTERMRITADGLVGINFTPTADSMLTIKNSDDATYWLIKTVNDNGNTNSIFTQNGSGDFAWWGYKNGSGLGTPDIAFSTAADCYFRSQKLGVGTATVSAQLHSLSTTEQLRIGYDASNYLSFTVGSANAVTIANAVAADISINCGADKTIVLTETVWDDFPPNPIVAAKLGSSAPTLATFVTDIEQYTFDAVNDYVIGSTEIPHNWKEGTVIYPHIHWATNGLDATERGVKWQLKWTVGDALEVFSAQVTSTVDATIPASTTDRTHFISEFTTTLDGANLKIGAVICWRLERIATAHANGAPSNDPFALSIGFHGEMDTVGSRGRTSK